MIIDNQFQETLIKKYRQAKNRLILLDYDGTLVEYKPKPEQAVPSEELVDMLGNLACDQGSEVIIVTGRDHLDIDSLLGRLPVDIIASHGAIMKEQGEWKEQVPGDTGWKRYVRPVMDQVCAGCNESFVEDKHFSLAWHYRNAASDSGYACSRDLIQRLAGFLEPFDLKVLDGNMVIEVMHRKIGKGIAVRKILAGKNYDFILSAGDDVTDEEIFDFLEPFDNAFTIKVGNAESHARFRFISVGDTVSFLNKLKK
jgi:trehalose 6-phosphate synthase/phosphatase